MDAEHPYTITSTTNVTGLFGRLIGFAEGPKWGAWRHSYIVLPDRLFEAAPGGCRFHDLEEWTGSGKVVYSDQIVLTPSQQALLEEFCKQMEGRPYDYLGDLVVGLDSLWLDYVRKHDGAFRTAERFLDRGDAWFCSALADAAMTAAGGKVFDDGRPFHAVSPANLAQRLVSLGNVIELAGVPA